MIDRAAILGNGKSLEIAASLGAGGPLMALSPQRSLNSDQENDESSSSPTIALATLDAAMKSHIEGALATTQGRVEGKRGAAKMLGINPHTLRARMRKLGIRWGEFRE